jgi:hypothetical protein
MMMQRPANEPKPCVRGQISRGLLKDELPYGATKWVMCSALALFRPSGRRGKLIEQALQALG